jgi:predicted dehydrogenase
MSIEDCDAISAAAERSSGMLMVNFGNRHRPAARILRDRVQRGDFGTTQILTVRGHEPATKTGTLSWRARTDPTWFLVSHLVDFTLWLTEERIISVFGVGASGHPEQLTDVPGMNSVSYLASLERGGHAILTSTWILPEGYPRRGDFSCNLIGTEGAADVVFNELGLRFFRDTAEEISWDWDTPDFRGFRSGWWFTSCEYFLDCVTRGVQPTPSARDATEVTAVLCAMQHSLHTGQAVTVESFRSVQHETRAEVGPAT